MRKIPASLLILIMIICTVLHAESPASEDTLNITAFKPFKSGIKLHVNNALTMEDISNGTVINLNEIAGDLMGNADNIPSTMTSNVIFSYRVEGADQPQDDAIGLTYTLTITAEPLKNITNEEAGSIPVLYQLGHFDATFPGTASILNNHESGGWTINYASEAVYSQKATESSPFSKEVSWTVKETNDQGITMPNWITRGAIGMVIDYASYNEAAHGVYRADISLTLEVQ